ncbi:hypothetical protein K491DRAFT_386763 [Lophiostoma macrostomum CBS 122681]|uniref:Uncharacterized protein n=1 Tax=Lophiostoma macrostomum CBS 122681 TaxID=1314788 RepID=A0A6A6TR48_9PLEO|nr:hypothetical protein K491DRAFT_386763 [Lophiostoma macrostomum CBS 122681]
MGIASPTLLLMLPQVPIAYSGLHKLTPTHSTPHSFCHTPNLTALPQRRRCCYRTECGTAWHRQDIADSKQSCRPLFTARAHGAASGAGRCGACQQAPPGVCVAMIRNVTSDRRYESCIFALEAKRSGEVR